MSVALRPYPAYKSSRMPWLGEVPAHWTLWQLGHYCQVGNGSTPSRAKPEYWAESGVPWLNSACVHQGRIVKALRYVTERAFKECHLPLVPTGSILIAITGQGKTRGTTAILAMEATISQHVVCLRPKEDVAAAPYLRWVLSAAYGELRRISDGSGGTKGALTCEDMKHFKVALPTVDEQQLIAAFLNAHSQTVARYILNKQRLIALLNEQKQAIIDRAVTRGVDGEVPLAPSGIEGTGNVPAHWVVKPLKRWVSINKRSLPETTDRDYSFQYLEIATVGTGFLARQPERMRFGDAPSRARRMISKGDTIISTVRTYLKAVYFISVDTDDLVASTGFAALTPSAEVLPEYLGYVVQGGGFVERVTAHSVGVAYPAIAESRLGSFHLAIPPSLEEQCEIVECIKVGTQTLETVIQRALREIALMREYRARLIADVVTGKLDVRHVAPEALPVMATPEDLSDVFMDDELDDVRDDAAEV